MLAYRFLDDNDFSELYRCFLEAFSDYVVDMRMSETQFQERMIHNGVRLDLSVGAFESKKMVGFTINGFDAWNGKPTAYDAGTGVVPIHRGKGIGTELFGFMLPKLKDYGARQYLLEVITTNKSAVNLYRKLNFQDTRKLAVFQSDKQINQPANKNRIAMKIREIKTPDWLQFHSFWDGRPSWQNSIESIRRSRAEKTIFAAFLNDECVGYGIVFPVSGSISQLGVAKNYRRKGIGSALLKAIQGKVGELKPLRITNVDYALDNALAFCKAAGFERVLSQFEMTKDLL